MTDWKSVVQIGDIHRAFRASSMTIPELTAAVGKKFRENVYAPEMEDGCLIFNLETAENLEDYDEALDDLYDFGDRDHRVWIDTADDDDQEETV